MVGRNEEVATLLENIGKLLTLKGESYFRVRAYMEAAANIRALAEDVAVLYRTGRLREIPGIGEGIAARIGEYLETGRSSYYEQLQSEIPVSALDLLRVPGIGPARAQLLHKHLGLSTIEDLIQAAEEHRLQRLPSFSAALEARIARDAALVAGRTQRLLLGKALPAAEEVIQRLRTNPAVQDIQPVGSLRRMQETVGAIEILASSDRPAEVVAAFISLPSVSSVLVKEPARAAIVRKDGLQVHLRVAEPERYGAALLYFTGSTEHTSALSALAAERGWTLSEIGLFEHDGQRRAAQTEEEVYRALGMDWIPPELRENRGEIEAAKRHHLPALVNLDAIRGDLHVHTDWSDGRDPPERMIEAAIARGYHYIAFTDHSRSLRVARGLSLERVQEQRRLIDRLNQQYAPFRVLHGTEVDILPNGDLDYPDEVLAEFDIVTASVHSRFAQPGEHMTERIIRALRHPYVDVLNHLTGRLLQRRPAYPLDVEAVLAAAAENGVIVEINGQPDRLDINDEWARRAQEMGILLVCNSDAHAAHELGYMRYAVAVARRAWAEPANVLNTLPPAAPPHLPPGAAAQAAASRLMRLTSAPLRPLNMPSF